jgi:hypothetical protein
VHLTADIIHTRTRARHFLFFAWASAPHTLDGKGDGTGRDGTGLACVFALCLILYLGWENMCLAGWCCL